MCEKQFPIQNSLCNSKMMGDIGYCAVQCRNQIQWKASCWSQQVGGGQLTVHLNEPDLVQLDIENTFKREKYFEKSDIANAFYKEGYWKIS